MNPLAFFIVAALACIGALTLLAWAIELTARRMNKRTATKQMALQPPPAPFPRGGLLDFHKQLVGEIAQSFTVPAHLLWPKPAPIHFDTWMRERTERAHREFMERTSRRLPCDWSTEDIARYMGAPID